MPGPSRFLRIDRIAPATVVGLTLLVFAFVVAIVTFWARQGLREQILERQAETFSAVVSMQLGNDQAALTALGVNVSAADIFVSVLKTAKLRGVLAMRVLDDKQQFAGAVPAWAWSDEAPAEADWSRLMRTQPISRLRSPHILDDIVDPTTSSSGARRLSSPVEIWVPLLGADKNEPMGVAQFLADGSAIDAEFAAIDRRLLIQAVFAWAAGAVIIGFALAWAFRRLAEANRELTQRSEDLRRANRELVLAAKTSALGTITAHLFHEIKNPLASLEVFVANQAENAPSDDRGGELAAASELTRRLRTMVNDVMGVLRDEHAGAGFELTGEEIIEIAAAKVRTLAKERGVALAITVTDIGTFSGREANLIALVLQNLLQNALEATPREGRVRVETQRTSTGEIAFSVEDSGPGLPDPVKARLFQPAPSSKAGGSGLGLALSQRLAQQAGGTIQLVHSNSHGTLFRLVLSGLG